MYVKDKNILLENNNKTQYNITYYINIQYSELILRKKKNAFNAIWIIVFIRELNINPKFKRKHNLKENGIHLNKIK